METFIRGYHAYVPATQTAIYTAPAGKTGIVKYFQAANTGGPGRTLTMWVGGTTTDKILLAPTTIAGGATYVPPTGFIVSVPSGSTVYAQASVASSIVLLFDVLEID